MSLLSQFYPGNDGGGSSLATVGAGAIPPGHIAFYGGEFLASGDAGTYGDASGQATKGSSGAVFRAPNYYTDTAFTALQGPTDFSALSNSSHVVIKGHAAQLGAKGSSPGTGGPGVLEWRSAIEISGIKIFQGYQAGFTANFQSCTSLTDMWFEDYEGGTVWTVGNLTTCYNVGNLQHPFNRTATWNLGAGSSSDAVSNLVLEGFRTPPILGSTTVNGYPLANLSAAAQAHVAANATLNFTS